MKYKIRYLGDPVLRQKAKPVEAITEDIKQLVEGLLTMLRKHNGVGLAAPQIGYSVRVFVMVVIEEDDYGRTRSKGERVYINPKIVSVSDELVGMNEGCISIPGIYVDDIMRPKTITIESMNLQGETVVETITSWHARVCLHENDHLNGVLYIDRLSPKQRKEFDKEFIRIKQRIKKIMDSESGSSQKKPDRH